MKQRLNICGLAKSDDKIYILITLSRKNLYFNTIIFCYMNKRFLIKTYLVKRKPVGKYSTTLFRS